jgi:hypothetical protein
MKSPTIPQPPSLPLAPQSPQAPSLGSQYRTGNKKNTGQAPGPKKSFKQSMARQPDVFKEAKLGAAQGVPDIPKPEGPISFLQNGQWKMN